MDTDCPGCVFDSSRQSIPRSGLSPTDVAMTQELTECYSIRQRNNKKCILYLRGTEGEIKRHAMYYNVTLRRFRAAIVAVECVFVALGIQHAKRMLYCHIWPLHLYNIFPHYLINGRIIEKTIEHKMCVLIFSTTFV